MLAKREVMAMTRRFRDSLQNLYHIRPLATAAMLLAVQVALGLVVSFPVGQYIRISFGYLALSSAGALLGPAVAAVNGALADVIGHFLKPMGAYFPGFTITGVVSGLIYGFMLYHRDFSLKRLLVTKLLIDVACNLLLNTLWLYIMSGNAALAMFPQRAIKNLAQYPVDIALAYYVLKRVCAMRRF